MTSPSHYFLSIRNFCSCKCARHQCFKRLWTLESPCDIGQNAECLLHSSESMERHITTAIQCHALGLFKRFKIPDTCHGTHRTSPAHVNLTRQAARIAGSVEEGVRHELVGRRTLLRALLAAPVAQSQTRPARERCSVLTCQGRI